MLAMLLPEQIAEHWDELKGYIQEASPDMPWSSEDRMNDILEQLIIGRMAAWISYGREDKLLDGLVVTSIFDDSEGVRSLLIHSVWAKKAKDSSWIEGWKIIRDYAISRKCKKVTAYTKIANVKNRAKAMGFDTSCTYLEIGI